MLCGLFVLHRDSDQDGLLDSEDPSPFAPYIDTDGDGVEDSADAFPLVSLTGRSDSDGDGRPDECDGECVAMGMIADDDDDDDGVPDITDAYPVVSLDGRSDIDGDGFPDDCDAVCEASGMMADVDDDNDGVIDTEDAFPLDAGESVDTDGDLVGNNADLDDDGDSVPDIVDAFPLDSTRVFELSSRLVNISTRGFVGTGDDAMIGGVIIQGEAPLTVVVRGRGPSLADFGIENVLADPSLQLTELDGTTIDSNLDWQDHPSASQIPMNLRPTNASEAAFRITLEPGAYTTILRGQDGGTGVGIVEVFEVVE